MSVRYAAGELAPHVCAVYVCDGCGCAVTRHGNQLATAPPGWVEVPDDEQPDHACPRCARQPER